MDGLRSFIKQRDLFEKASIELGLKCVGVPGVNVERQWSSTIKMSEAAYKVRTVVKAMINWISEISELVIIKYY